MIEEKKTLKKVTKKKKFSLSSLSWNIFRAGIWFYFISNKVPTVHISNFLIQIPAETLLFEVSLVYLIYLILHRNGLAQSIAKFINFYVAFVLFIPWYIFRSIVFFPLGLTNLIKPFFELSKKILFHIVIGVLLILSIRNILLFNSPAILYCSIIVITFCLLVSFASLCGWTSDPLYYTNQYGSLIDLILKWWKRETVYKTLDKTERNKAEVITALNTLWSEYSLTSMIETPIDNSLKGITTKLDLIKDFVLIFLFNVTLTISIFAFDFFAIFKINKTSFLNTSGKIFDFIYFSTVTFTTLGDNSVTPNSVFAKVLIIFEGFSGLFLLTIIVLSFSSITTESAIATYNSWKEKIKIRKDAILDLVEKLGLTKNKFINAKNLDDLNNICKTEINIKDATSKELKPINKLPPPSLNTCIILNSFFLCFLWLAYDLIFKNEIGIVFKVIVGILGIFCLVLCSLLFYRMFLILTARLRKQGGK